MKAIFLDFNGVLDTYEEIDIIDPDNLKILIDIINETNSKLIITSSIKNTYFQTGKHNKIMNYLIKNLKVNGLKIYDITKKMSSREEEIKHYLKHHKEITHYCIIDDDYFFKSMEENMVKLTPQIENGEGLKEIGKEKIIKILNR